MIRIYNEDMSLELAQLSEDNEVAAFLDRAIWGDSNRSSYEASCTYDYKNLRDLEIPLFQTNGKSYTRLTIGELLEVAMKLKTITAISSGQAKKSLARFGVLITRDYDVFIARSNNNLLETELRKGLKLLSLDWFLRRLPNIRISPTPRRLFDKVSRGVLIRIEDFLGLSSIYRDAQLKVVSL